MGLADLPVEILTAIHEDDDLEVDDYKSLRLATRIFHAVSTEKIFRTVRISKTKRDWDTFRSIASSPLLARCVKELVWYELLEDDKILCHSQGMEQGCWCESKATEWAPVTAHELAPLAKDIFWLTAAMCEERPSEKLMKYQNDFFSSLRSMPALDSFVVMPMPPTYALSDDPYGLTAGLFYRCVTLRGPGYTRHSIHPGFFHFLAPTMAREGSNIRSLHFIDHPKRSAIYNFTVPPCPAFDHLTQINLCLNFVNDCEGLVACLRRAKSLKSLRICLDRSAMSGNQGVMANAASSLFDHKSTRYWPSLTIVELVEVYLRRQEEINVYSDDAFIAFLEAHAPTLRHLTLQKCQLYRNMVERIATVPGLNLSSLRILVPDHGVTHWVNEDDLLEFVNGKETSGRAISGVRDYKPFNTFSWAGSPLVRKARAAFASDATDNVVEIRPDDARWFRGEDLRGRSQYARERRGCGEIKWKFGRVGESVYNWRSEDPAAHETQEWLFQHRSGETGVGDEPLEYFSDWDTDSDTGDVTEPLPTGPAWERFVSETEGLSQAGDEVPAGVEPFCHTEHSSSIESDWLDDNVPGSDFESDVDGSLLGGQDEEEE